MIGDIYGVFGALHLYNAEQIAQAVMDLREHYRRYMLPQPPLPEKIAQASRKGCRS
jgi:hypothetical protein